VIVIAGGNEHSLALKNDGTVWAWGGNGSGQLGDGTNIGSSTPVQVVLYDYVAIAGGIWHSLALRSDGTVWAWGSSFNGELGDGRVGGYDVWALTPIQVIDPSDNTGYLTDVVAIAAGECRSLALKSDGTVWTWGNNLDGQLGIGTTYTDSNIPVEILGLTDIISISTSWDHSLALDIHGNVWAWGVNYYGQLGDGTNNNSLTPIQVIDTADNTGYLTGSLRKPLPTMLLN
ncbi:MAG: RCC1 repeat-containing protein, partial [Dehalococcoidia bacterium]|nr:RCC1 repeat-containing protein [Dehalococcoidia bacterium]